MQRLRHRALGSLLVALVALGAHAGCGGGEALDGSSSRSSTTSPDAADAAARPAPSVYSAPLAEEPGVDPRGTTVLRAKIVGAPAADAVDHALDTINRRLVAFGAPPSAVERSGDAILVSWDRGNVADEVVAVAVAPGHLQLRVVTQVRPGACAADSLPAEALPSTPISVSLLQVPASCYWLAAAEISDPVVDCMVRHQGSWKVVTLFSGESRAALDRLVDAHSKSKVALVVDAVLLEVARGDALARDGELVSSGGFDERAARHYAAVVAGGPHDLELRLERFQRQPG